MDGLQTLSTPKSNKRKAVDVTPSEQKQKAKRSVLTDAQMTEAVDIFHACLVNKESAVSVVPSGSHFVLHLRELSGEVRLDQLESALAAFNKLYLVRGVTINLERRFIDVRFRLGPGPSSDLPNVVQVAERVLPDVSQSSFSKLTEESKLDRFDLALIASVMTHADHVLGPDTPEDTVISIDTPSGQTLTAGGCEDNKKPRTNYLIAIKGYRELDIQHLRSFMYILPFHGHSPAINFDNHSVQLQLESYHSPIRGAVLALKAELL